MQATVISLKDLGISLDHDIKCDFTRGPLPGIPCNEIAVARITFKCKCGYKGTAFICEMCLNNLRNDDCRCAKCGNLTKPHWWSVNRCKWREI